MSTKILSVNGRFLSRNHTGVERVAKETLNSIEEVLSICDKDPSSILSYLFPKLNDHIKKTIQSKEINYSTGSLSGQFWEQVELPKTCYNTWLYNPCNVGPIFKRKSILTIHDAQVYLVPNSYSASFRIWYKTLLPILGRTSKIVTTVSQYSKEKLEYFNVVPKGKIKVIYNGCDHIKRIKSDINILDRYNIHRKEYYFAIGSLSPHKNLNILSGALPLLKERNIPLVVAGSRMEKIFTSVDETQDNNVIYLGRVTDSELKALYENALCLLFPSLFEGFGLPPLEAMSCGCPVIASNTSSIPEICRSSVLYANPRSYSEWASKMNEITSDLELQQTMVRKGYHLSSIYTWRKAAISLLKLIAEMDKDRVFYKKLSELELIN
ncbi:MAG: glycosyltransferase family 4 protein [Candidatus Thiodiazotropha endolucinida]|nr:glycosyltransferase family 4 protein [Candidatus Thiodiazotropha taylori]MCW4318369.1 glycosyltransferase family 4 protein [Candidatus Thiodiazotropha taylori]